MNNSIAFLNQNKSRTRAYHVLSELTSNQVGVIQAVQ